MFSLLRICSHIPKIKTVTVVPKTNVFKTFTRQFSGKTLDVNTNVIKDVILFKCDNGRFFKILNLFSICQFGFWSYLSMFAFTTLRDAPVDASKEDVWWRKINLGETKYRYGLTIMSFALGFGILAITWTYTLKSVKYLVLRKGGKEITLVTYAPFGQNRMFTLDVQNLSAKEARSAAKTFIPIKVKGHYFHYILDTRGQFKNPVLYDHTAGLKRVWAK